MMARSTHTPAAVILVFVAVTGFCDSMNDHLVAHWSFDADTDGVVWDAGLHGLDGVAGDIIYGQGVIGPAAVFDGAHGGIFILAADGQAPPQIADLAQGAISVWFNYQSIGARILPILYFGESDSGAPHNSLIIEIGHGDNPENRRLYFTIINARFCYDSGVNLEPGQWYHFAAVVGPEGNTGYLDGRELTDRHYNLGSNARYSDFFASVPVRELLALGYGRYGKDDRFYHFLGSIDDVRIYDRPLDANEVSDLHESAFGPLPTHENVAYGPHERNVLDFWQADSDRPTPVVVYIHGGGFRSGDKTGIRTASGLAEIAYYLDHGISFAAINYRFRTTTTLDHIILDCARAIQYLRQRADEWNIDKTRIASYGGSAGGGASLWLGVHDDLADPNSDDPVLRESSRLAALGHLNSQATYDFVQWPEILGIDPNWPKVMNSREDLELYGITDRSRLWDPDIVAMRAFLDMPAFMDPTDPPIYTSNLKPDTEPRNANEVIHHPRHAMYLQAECDLLGIPCTAILADTPAAERIRLADFFIDQLAGPDRRSAEIDR